MIQINLFKQRRVLCRLVSISVIHLYNYLLVSCDICCEMDQNCTERGLGTKWYSPVCADKMYVFFSKHHYLIQYTLNFCTSIFIVGCLNRILILFCWNKHKHTYKNEQHNNVEGFINSTIMYNALNKSSGAVTLCIKDD